MGADAARKEARKRKFAHIQHSQDVESSTRIDALGSAGKGSLKKVKLLEPDQLIEETNQEQSQEHEDDPDQDALAAVASPPSKPARFICFIGDFSTFIAYLISPSLRLQATYHSAQLLRLLQSISRKSAHPFVTVLPRRLENLVALLFLSSMATTA